MTIDRIRSIDVGDVLNESDMAAFDDAPRRRRVSWTERRGFGSWQAWTLGVAKVDTRFAKKGAVNWYEGVNNQNIVDCMPHRDNEVVEIMPAEWKPGTKPQSAPKSGSSRAARKSEPAMDVSSVKGGDYEWCEATCDWVPTKPATETPAVDTADDDDDFDRTPRTVLPAWLVDDSYVLGKRGYEPAAAAAPAAAQVVEPAPVAVTKPAPVAVPKPGVGKRGKLAKREAAGQFAFDFAA